MPMILPPFRRATLDDTGTLAELVEFASEGLAVYLWSKLAGTGDPWTVGCARVGSETGGLSYRNAVVAELAGRPAAGLISYPLADQPEPVSDKLPAMLLPLQELMNLALGTWYVHVLAAYPEHRGRGQGAALLALADRLAASAGKPGLSLVVSDTNVGARRLYENWGYREAAQRKMVKEQWRHPGVNWVLLRKDL
ncbi:MAG: GNAT family N-acetyltransferase [Hyphomonadaceae bacterium]|jgi:GNAT superfamily N-acetyltransferase|nr:GNAT family N-acetyltransferase [Hyphomonadaceae bacterium]